MADTIKKNATSDAKKKTTVRLPRKTGKDAIQFEFFSVNFKNYLVACGQTVEVPDEVAEVIRNNEQAEDFAMQFIEEKVLKQPRAQ